MTKKTLFVLWGVLFCLCAVLGFVPAAGGARGMLTLLSVLFFVPPTVLVYRGKVQKDRNTLLLVRNFSAASLILTVVLLILNLLSAMQSEFVGNVLYGVLVVVSAPMVCSGYWALSLFLWACLLIGSISVLRK